MTETFVKRARRATQRLSASFAPGWKTRACFLHIPKCAGNSIIEALNAACPLHERASWITVPETRAAVAAQLGGAPEDYPEDGPRAAPLFAHRATLLQHHLHHRHRVVSGHFLFDRDQFQKSADDFKWVTVVREPVARMISHYREEARSGFVQLPFADYLATDMAYQHATALTRYLGGVPHLSPEGLPNAVERATSNLEHFSLIGDLSDLQTFMTGLERLIGRPLQVGHERPAVHPMPDISDADHARVEEMCTADREVYAYARGLMTAHLGSPT